MKKQSARTQIATKKAEREVNKANKTAGVTPSTTKGIEGQRKTLDNKADKGASRMSSSKPSVDLRTAKSTKHTAEELRSMENMQMKEMSKYFSRKTLTETPKF